MFFERDFGNFASFGISPIRTRFEPYLTSRRRPEMILLRHETPICRKGNCQRKMPIEKSNKWTLTIGLALLPTKAKDLKVNVKDSKLNLKGTSQTEQKIGGFGLNSKHEWSKTVEIPAWVDIKTIKVTLNEEKEKIVINGSKKIEDKDIIQVSDEEIDVELEELLDAAERKKEELKKDQDEGKMKS